MDKKPGVVGIAGTEQGRSYSHLTRGGLKVGAALVTVFVGGGVALIEWGPHEAQRDSYQSTEPSSKPSDMANMVLQSPSAKVEIAGGSWQDFLISFIGQVAEVKQVTISYDGLPMDKLTGNQAKDRETRLLAAASGDLNYANVEAACAAWAPEAHFDWEQARVIAGEFQAYLDSKEFKNPHGGKLAPRVAAINALDACGAAIGHAADEGETLYFPHV